MTLISYHIYLHIISVQIIYPTASSSSTIRALPVFAATPRGNRNAMFGSQGAGGNGGGSAATTPAEVNSSETPWGLINTSFPLSSRGKFSYVLAPPCSMVHMFIAIGD